MILFTLTLIITTLTGCSSSNNQTATNDSHIIIIAQEAKAMMDGDAKILVYCRSGRRSAQAAEKLVELGYTNIYDFGGINSWEYDIVTK